MTDAFTDIVSPESGAAPDLITTHRCGDPLNERISIERVGERGAGGAYTNYYVRIDPKLREDGLITCYDIIDLDFQTGNPADEVNGISNEALLAIVADRLEGFQSGPMACEANQLALEHVQDALDHLQHRSRERMARGVGGTTLP